MRDVCRLLVADGHVLFRQGIQALLRDYSDLEVVGEAASGFEALEKSRALRPDIVLIDAQLSFAQLTPQTSGSSRPNGSHGHRDGMGHEPEPWEECQGGLETAQRFRAELPATRVVLLTAQSEPSGLVYEAIRAGAMGFVTKACEVGELVAAIRSVARGQAGITAGSLTNLLSILGGLNPSGQERTDDPEKTLSDREEEVLDLVAQAYSNREIAMALFISESTVRSHLHNILGKLHLSNRVQAATYSLTTRRRRAAAASNTPTRDLAGLASVARSIGSAQESLSQASTIARSRPINHNGRLGASSGRGASAA